MASALADHLAEIALAVRRGLETVEGTHVNLLVDLVRDTGPERAARTLDAILLALLLTTVAGARTAEAQTEEPETWWTVRSEHFVIWTDATPERGAEVARNLELFRSVFARLAPELELRNPTPTKIIAFRDGRELNRHAGVMPAAGIVDWVSALRHRA